MKTNALASLPRSVPALSLLLLLLSCATPNLLLYLPQNEPEDYDCLERNIYTASERRANYPFNVSSRIELISFHQPDSASLYRDALPVDNGVVDYSRVVERTDVRETAIDSLTHIFYNFGYTKEIYKVNDGCCFMPRNAILFFNKRGKLLEYIDICFECGHSVYSSDKVSLGEECYGKHQMLQRFFKSHSIEIGITKETKHPLRN